MGNEPRELDGGNQGRMQMPLGKGSGEPLSLQGYLWGQKLPHKGSKGSFLKKMTTADMIFKLYFYVRGWFCLPWRGRAAAGACRHGAGEDASSQDGDKLGRIFPFGVRLRVKTFLPTLWEAESSCGMSHRHHLLRVAVPAGCP